MPGVLVGAAVAMKFFVWPLALWLLAIRNQASAALSVGIAAASLLLIIPFTSIVDYGQLIHSLSRTFDHQSYTIYGFLVDSGIPSTAARGANIVTGLVIVALAWRRCSFPLAIAAALVLSPIVWLHFFALLVVPLAIAKPRFHWAWLLPLPAWLATGTYNGEPWQSAIVLASFTATIVVCERSDQAPRRTDRGRPWIPSVEHIPAA